MSIEKTLFAVAEKVRGTMAAGDYKHIALALLFLRYVLASLPRPGSQPNADEYAKYRNTLMGQSIGEPA